jgi:hypothetical protein
MTAKQKDLWTDGKIIVRQFTYDSGFVEISATIPEVLDGAGPIMVGVVARQPGERCKWCAYTDGARPSLASPIKRRAVNHLTEHARKEYAKRAHLYPAPRMSPKCPDSSVSGPEI